MKALSTDLDRSTVEQAYARWAPFYDTIVGPLCAPARRTAVQAASRVGRRILEVGVGTGLSFREYPDDVLVTGVDLSAPMLEKARRRAASGRFPQVRELAVMDAQDLQYPDASFDCVLALFVITLVQSPERVLEECARVVRPGGEVILVNHFYSERGVAAAVERWFGRHFRSIGLRPEFPFGRVADWVAACPGASLIERRQVRPYTTHTLVRLRRERAPLRAVPPAAEGPEEQEVPRKQAS